MPAKVSSNIAELFSNPTVKASAASSEGLSPYFRNQQIIASQIIYSTCESPCSNATTYGAAIWLLINDRQEDGYGGWQELIGGGGEISLQRCAQIVRPKKINCLFPVTPQEKLG